MIRSSLYHLASNTPQLSSALASQVVKPAAVVFSGKLSTRSFSMRPKHRHDHEHKILDDAIDDSSDAITPPRGDEKQVSAVGAGAATETTATKPKSLSSFAEQALRRHLKTRPDWPDFFWSAHHRNPFDHPFFAARSAPLLFHDPFFSEIMNGNDDNHAMTSRRRPIMPVLDNNNDNNDDDTLSKNAKDMTLLRSSPGFEIKESDSMYEIDIGVPKGVQASDMKVELEQNGTVLHVSGERKIEKDNSVSSTFFDQHFTIGRQLLDTSALTANFCDGVLVVKAPKLVIEETENEKQTITITENKPHDDVKSNEQVLQTNYSDAFDESDWVETGKRSHLENE